jgi:Cys-tRNA(Pro) deacylase
MSKEKFPTTQAIRSLKHHKIEFSIKTYKYEEKGGTAVAASELNLDEHRLVKTLVMENENGHPFLILMHGDNKVSTKALARALGVKTVSPCDPKVAQKHTGYFVGGTSPFGTKKPLKIYIEKTIVDFKKIYINAGKRGLLVEISPDDLMKTLNPTPVNVAIG